MGGSQVKGEKYVIVYPFDYKKILTWIHALWGKSLAVVIALIIGWSLGSMSAESRIVGDCKFSGAFRVEIQAFACQRKI
jgi:hypothetical protein